MWEVTHLEVLWKETAVKKGKPALRVDATDMPSLHGTNSMKLIITKRSALIQNLARPAGAAAAQEYGRWQDQMGSTWVFTYWEAGDKVTRASSIPAVFFSGVWEN
jgi:hypothetical protein